jgi:hypothetical protein
MTNEEINKIIAEFRGWVMYHPTPESISRGYPSYSYWTPPRDSKQFAENWGKLEMDYPPDYCNDLNAMHEAEKTLSRGQNYHQLYGFGFYINTLTQICYQQHILTATASQRAEAFVRTIDKWKD